MSRRKASHLAKFRAAVEAECSAPARVEVDRGDVLARAERWASITEGVGGQVASVIAPTIDVALAWLDLGRADIASSILTLLDIGDPDVAWRATAVLARLADEILDFPT